MGYGHKFLLYVQLFLGNAGWGTLIRPPSPICNKKNKFLLKKLALMGHQSQLFNKKLFFYNKMLTGDAHPSPV
jgi:hypothetical protein